MNDLLTSDRSEAERGTLARPSGAWLRPELSAAARAAELAALDRQATRDRWRDLGIAAVEGSISLGVGLYLIGWSFHTTNQGWGAIAMLAGVAVGNAGLMITLIRAHARAIERGDL